MKRQLFFTVFVAAVVVMVCCTLVRAARQNDSQRTPRRPRAQQATDPIKAGMQAPDFTLLRLNSYSVVEKKDTSKTAKLAKQETVSLSSYKGKRPVVLFFSSYT